jgi:uncharacterized membrane protein
MTDEDLARMWSDPAHWNRDGSCKCVADPRLLVRSQSGLGWTLYMKHPRAALTMVGFVLSELAFVVIVGIWAVRRAA